MALVTYNLAIDAGRMVEHIKIAVDAGSITLLAWLKGIPLVGAMLDGYINKIIGSPEELLVLAKSLLEPARHYVLGGGILLGSGVAQTSLAGFVSFVLYLDGKHLLHALAAGMQRIIGDSTAGVLLTVNRTVSGVMYEMLGTALAQATVAMLGFVIAGVPAVLLLGVATLLLSLMPVGPPLIWGGVAIWLFDQGRNGSAIFMLLWGFFLISSIDNVIKPMLISCGSCLPFLLVLLGVLGGVIAFGCVGLFIGPTLLAIAYGLLRNWIGISVEQL
jgi:predicted PurR-regulated permease PerM